ncbi:AraC family transcriptional regulator [Rhizobium sp. NTR19]|uniref:AraC family transcriptional regulator n=1 Tax=Neorhizobium turbinariae TaxID=2937795 RepID=A0ABT0IN64_9HYPH|nr:helix-turn-helix domain-containing protein [Neorhizobium turbinariae]MCK8779324.1 AraC family transcriptional regulator [Neorhizobium turbinariae]
MREPVQSAITFAPPTASAMEARLFGSSLHPLIWTLRKNLDYLFIILSGSGSITANGRHSALEGPVVVWSPATDGSISLEAGSEGGMLAAPDVILGQAMPAGAVSTQVREAITRLLISRSAAADARQMLNLLGSIEGELKGDEAGSREAVQHYIALLLLKIWRMSDPVQHPGQPSPRMIVRGFVHLVELHVRDHWGVPQYASALGVTSDRLNTAIRRATGRSPMEVVHARMLTEAARLLHSSAMQTGEIAELLGFRDAAYFSRFFKRLMGMSPRQYRQQAVDRRGAAQDSYAAWP